MAPRTVRRLFDLEVDEISTVDRAANQHADVVIAKRAGDPMPEQPVYDDEGYELDADELEPGDRVWLEGQDGQLYEHVMVEDDTAGGEEFDEGGEYVEDYDDELVGVGKASPGQYLTAARRGYAGIRPEGRRNGLDYAMRQGRRARAGVERGRSAASTGRNVGRSALAGARGQSPEVGMSSRGWRSGAAANRHRGKIAATGAAGGTYAASKSLGSSVYAELSKALRDTDRDQVIAKFADYVEDAQAQANEAWEIAKGLQEERDLVEYVGIAREYGLPGDPIRIGGILKRCADTMPAPELAELDRLLSAAGAAMTFGKELGYGGAAQISGVYEEIEAMAREAVGKSAGEVSTEAAITALFDANPDAYDAYNAEQAQNRRF